MALLTDRLNAEVDRQLAEVRTQADGIAARAGFMTSAAAISGGILGSQLATLADNTMATIALIALGISTFLGIVTVGPVMAIGPGWRHMDEWSRAPVGGTSISDTVAADRASLLYAAKVSTLRANALRLRLMQVFFYLQAIGVVTAVTLALVASRG